MSGVLTPGTLVNDHWKFEVVGKAIEEGMWPFRFGSVCFYSGYDLDFLREWVVAELTPIIGNSMFYGKIYFSRDELIDYYPIEFYVKMAERFFNAFRYRPRVEPESNIELGEN